MKPSSMISGRKNGKLSFKNLVRSIIRASRWQISLDDGKEESSCEDLANKTWYEEQDTLHFNVNAFKSGYPGNGLSKRAKFILLKNPWERTDEELELIQGLVDRMKSFEKYSPLVKRELSRVMHFETFEEGRVMLREGHQGFSMYFIVSGSVVVQVTQEDTRTNEKRIQTIGEISAGSSFGELALIQDCTRTATIVCKETCQFLRVDKPDFNMVLRRSYKKEWEDRLQILNSIPFFQQCSDADMRSLNLNCKVEDYQSDSIILESTESLSENVYFVISGVCKIIKKIQVFALKDTSGNTVMTLRRQQSGRRSHSSNGRNSDKIQTRFLDIGTMEAGDYFGAGEDFTDTYIVAFGRVECLLIPRQVIVALERLDNSVDELKKIGALKEMFKNTSARMLTEKEAFDKWMVNLGWKSYKKRIMSEILSTRSVRVETTKVEPHVHHQRCMDFPGNGARNTR